jgi:hypothetical protein
VVVPNGIRVADASAIVPEQDIFYFHNPETQKPDVAPFSDYFRIKLLSELGGWYCDVDTVCLSPELPTGSRIWARQCPELDKDSVNNSQLFFEPSDPLLLMLLDRCKSQLSTIQRRESLGPVLFSSVLRDLNLPRDMGANTEAFYPIRWIEIFKLWLPEFREEVEERVSGATFLPLYQSFPLYIGLDPTALPPQGSYLSALIDRLVPEASGAHCTAGEVRQLTGSWLSRNRSWAIDWLAAVCSHQSMAAIHRLMAGAP